MNIPKRASCHHFIRCARSASSPADDEPACETVETSRRCPGPPPQRFPGKAAAANAEPVPVIHSRRDVRLFSMNSSSQEISSSTIGTAVGGNTAVLESKPTQPPSEGESQPKLHLPGIMGERCDSPKSLVANCQSGITALRGRGVPVLDIEHIERLE